MDSLIFAAFRPLYEGVRQRPPVTARSPGGLIATMEGFSVPSTCPDELAALVRAHEAYVQGRLAPPQKREHAPRRPCWRGTIGLCG